jgi:hypothetical protein
MAPYLHPTACSSGSTVGAAVSRVQRLCLALSLISACLYVVWAFGTGQSGRRMSIYFVILVSASTAIVSYVTLGMATHDFEFDVRDVGAGLSGGFLNFLGTILLLKAIAMGRMGVVSGVNRSYVLIPIAYSLVIGESLGLVPAVGIVVIMLGLVLFCLPGMRGGGGVGSPQTIFFALGAAGPSASQLWCSTSGHGRTAAEHSPSRSVHRFW